MLRLIDAITLTPEAGILRIELEGNLAAMLGATVQSKRSSETGDLSLQVSMVAGACNQRYSAAVERGGVTPHLPRPVALSRRWMSENRRWRK